MSRLMVAVLFTGASLCAAPRISNCDAEFGSTGKSLASLLRDAAAVLPAEVKVGAGEVVLIRDLDRWAECRGIGGDSRTKLTRDLLAFTISEDFPIYVVAQNPSIQKAIGSYANGVSYLKYGSAVLLAHEWVHAYLHEAGEVPAYLFEIAVLKTYLAQKKLPPEYAKTLERTEAVLARARAQTSAGQDSLVQGTRDPSPLSQ